MDSGEFKTYKRESNFLKSKTFVEATQRAQQNQVNALSKLFSTWGIGEEEVICEKEEIKKSHLLMDRIGRTNPDQA